MTENANRGATDPAAAVLRSGKNSTAVDSTAPRHCQGCGIAEGAEQQINRNLSPHIVRLTETALADSGSRLLCPKCWWLLKRHMARLGGRRP